MVETLTMGGGESLAVRIANARAQRGQRSFLYVLTGPGPLSERLDPAVGVRYLNLSRGSVTRPWTFLASLIGGMRKLRDQLRTDNAEVVQCHLPDANFWGLTLAERRICPVIATVHSTREFDYGPASAPWKRTLRKIAYRRLLTRCQSVVAVSDEVRDALLSELGQTAKSSPGLVVVPNGVALCPPIDSAQRQSVRERLDLTPDPPLVVAAGRLVPLKAFDRLLEAAARVRDAGRHFNMVIAGEGECRPQLEEQIRNLHLDDRVRLPGNLDLTSLLPAADLYVLSSDYEGLPLVLLEAMGAGLPVVATRLAGLEALVEEPGAGVLVAPGDPAALADAIDELLADPARCDDLGRRGRQVIGERHAFATTLDRLDAINAGLTEVRGDTSC